MSQDRSAEPLGIPILNHAQFETAFRIGTQKLYFNSTRIVRAPCREVAKSAKVDDGRKFTGATMPDTNCMFGQYPSPSP
jgi:hypothetical protein